MSGGQALGGRFSGRTAPGVERFTTSLPSTSVSSGRTGGRWPHAEVLGGAGLLTTEEAGAITDGLRSILADVLAERLLFDPSLEDVHMAVESAADRADRSRRRQAPHRPLPERPGRLDLRLWVRDNGTPRLPLPRGS